MKRFLRPLFLKPLFYEIAVAIVVAAVSLKVTTLEWAVAYTFIALTLSLTIQVLIRVETIGSSAQEVFQASAIAHNLLKIRDRRIRLFTSIAEEQVRQLRIVLRRLGNGEHVAQGDEVFNIYCGLILDLKKDDEYLATTYVNDKFWDEIGGAYFFECNKKAVHRGAKITRVFLYADDTADFTKFPVVQKHVELKNSLDGPLRSNLRLFKLNVSKADSLKHIVEDKGILKNEFVMKLTVAPATIWKRATVCVDKDILAEEDRLFHRLLDDHEHLEPLEHAVHLRKTIRADEPPSLAGADDMSAGSSHPNGPSDDVKDPSPPATDHPSHE